jgi:putative two-component system response regulator
MVAGNLMSKNKAQILVVDDEVYIQEILKSTLEDAGYECAAVSDAESAITVIASQNFDIALLDIRIAGKRGAELLQNIKKGYPEIVVLLITAIDNESTAVESMRLGAYDYIFKPFNLDRVLISIHRALDKRRLENANRDYQKYMQRIAEESSAETRRLFYAITQVFVHLLDLKTPFNEGHSRRVAEKSRYVARELKMTDDEVRKVYLAALLHDVGTILVEDMLLNKEDALTADELHHIHEKSSLADEVLRPILDDEEVLRFIRHKRERYDGTGYPSGLKGNLIPLGSRVIAVVEAFDAITSERPYRLPRSSEEALEELQRCTLTQFDPQVVTVFADLYEKVFRNINQFSIGIP